MPEWIRQPSTETIPHFVRHFTSTRTPGCEFMFDVDPSSQEPVFGADDEQARQNYEFALREVEAGRMVDEGVLDFSVPVRDAGAIRCHCGAVVELTDDWEGAACQGCGTEYGENGQQFRANWRQFCRETGELED